MCCLLSQWPCLCHEICSTVSVSLSFCLIFFKLVFLLILLFCKHWLKFSGSVLAGVGYLELTCFSFLDQFFKKNLICLKILFRSLFRSVTSFLGRNHMSFTRKLKETFKERFKDLLARGSPAKAWQILKWAQSWRHRQKPKGTINLTKVKVL